MNNLNNSNASEAAQSTIIIKIYNDIIFTRNFRRRSWKLEQGVSKDDRGFAYLVHFALDLHILRHACEHLDNTNFAWGQV